MKTERLAWPSPHTGREMRLLRYGDAGWPLLYVPSSGGDETEFARYGMAELCAPWIEAGRVQFVSVDGSGPLTLWNDALTSAQRMAAFASFERYMADEAVPWLARVTGIEPVGVVGTSYGALVAANLLFRRPASVGVACGLGGVYGLWHRLDGESGEPVRAHMPLDYVPRLEDPHQLAAIRATRGLVMFAAADDPWLSSSERMQQVLRERDLPHSLEVWPSPADHHERWWREQLSVFLESLVTSQVG